MAKLPLHLLDSGAIHIPPEGWSSTHDLPLVSIQPAFSAFRSEGPQEFRDVRHLYWRRLACIADGWLVCPVMPGPAFGLGLYWLWTPQGHDVLDADAIDALVGRKAVSITSPAHAEEWVSLVALCRQDAHGKPVWLVPTLMQLVRALEGAAPDVADVLGRPMRAGRTDGGAFEVEATVVFSDGSLRRVRTSVLAHGKLTSIDVERQKTPAAPERAYAALTPDSVLTHSMRRWMTMLRGATEEESRGIEWIDRHAKWLYRLLKVVAFVGAAALAMSLGLWQAARASVRLLLMPGFALSRSKGTLYDIWAFYVRRLFAHLERHAVIRIGCVVAWFAALGLLVDLLPWPAAIVPAALLCAGYLHATFFVYLPNESIRTNIFRRVARDDEAVRAVHDFTWEYLGYVMLFLLCVPLVVFRMNLAMGTFVPDIAQDLGASYGYLAASLFKLVPDATQALMPQLSLAPAAVQPSTQLLQSLVVWLVQATVGTVVLAKIMAARSLRKEAVARLHRSVADAASLGMRIAPELRRIVSEGDNLGLPCLALRRATRRLLGMTPRIELMGPAALVLGLIDDRASAARLQRLWGSEVPDDTRTQALIANSLVDAALRLNPADSYLLRASAYGGDHPFDLWRAVAAMRSAQPAAEAVADLRLFLQWKHIAPAIRQQLAAAVLRVPGAYTAQDLFGWLTEFTGPEQLSEETAETLGIVAQALDTLEFHEVTSRMARLISLGPPQVWIPAVKLMFMWLARRHATAGYDGTALAMHLTLFEAFSERVAGAAASGGRLARWRLTARYVLVFMLLSAFDTSRKASAPRSAASGTPADVST